MRSARANCFYAKMIFYGILKETNYVKNILIIFIIDIDNFNLLFFKGTLTELKQTDPEKYKHEGVGFNNRAYLNLLDNKILPSILNFTNDFVYMHDNSPVHVAKYKNSRTADDVFQKHNANYLSHWPPNSPDLNPVEKVLSYLQNEYFKYIEKLTNKPKNKKDVLTCLKIVWTNLDNERVKNIFSNGYHVLHKVLEVNGNNNFKA